MADEKKASQKVIYLGNDSNFFQNIIQRFNSNYDKIEWEFPIFAISDKDQPHKYYLEVLDSFPSIIYLDFCSHPALVSTLSEYMSRDPYFKNIPLIGLVDNKGDVVPSVSAKDEVAANAIAKQIGAPVPTPVPKVQMPHYPMQVDLTPSTAAAKAKGR